MGNIEIFSSILVRDENPKFLIFQSVILVQSKYLTSRNVNNFSWMLVPFKQHLWKCKWVKILVGTESRFQVTEIPCFALVERKHFDDFGVLLHFLWGFPCGYDFWHKGLFYSIRGEKKKGKKYFYFVCTQLHFRCLGNASKGAKGREGRVCPLGGCAHTWPCPLPLWVPVWGHTVSTSHQTAFSPAWGGVRAILSQMWMNSFLPTASAGPAP